MLTHESLCVSVKQKGVILDEFTQTNDNARVEQKNWSVVRRLVGYGRYETQQQVDQLNAVYAVARLYINFFKPVMKLEAKRRVGSQVKKIYDEPKTPYRRLMDCQTLNALAKKKIESDLPKFEPVQTESRIGSADGGVETQSHFHRHAKRFMRQRANLTDTQNDS